MTWQSAIFPGSRTSVNVCLYLFVQLKNALSDAAKPAFTPGKLSLRAERRVWPKTKWTNKKVRNLCQAPNKIQGLIRLAVTCEVQRLHMIPSAGAAVMLLPFIVLACCRWYKKNHRLIVRSPSPRLQSQLMDGEWVFPSTPELWKFLTELLQPASHVWLRPCSA